MTPPKLTQAEFDYERQVRELRDINEALLLSSVRQHELTEQAQKAEQAKRASEERLATELAAMQRLQQISVQMIHQDNVRALYENILDAAVDIMRSDMASMQIVDEGENALRLQAFRGFEPEFGNLFELVGPGSPNTACKVARASGHRVVVPDVETCDFIGGTAALENHRKMGIRAVQSTPLVSRGGPVLGMMSTHWRYPHQPSERDLYLLDVLARQAADLIERSQAQESLRQADRRKDEFLAMLGHELRNPLGIISTWAQILRSRAVSASRFEELSDLDIIERQVIHTSRMLDDLLDISRIVSGNIQLKMQCCDFSKIVSQTVEDHREKFGESGIRLELHLPDQPISIMGDRTRLAQVLGNMLHNACKFTDKGGAVNVKLQAEKQETAALSIADTGMGVEPEALGWIFEPFRQAGRTLDHSRGGLGLGLALVKGIVKLHGGAVVASSEGVGRGSTFTIRLPIAHGEEVTADLRVEPDVRNSPKRILVIEDNPMAVRLTRRLLEMSGYAVETASSGRDGVELARKTRPDCVLCDIGLPELDGYAVATALRRDVGLTEACLIAVSGYPEDERRAREAGFNAHIMKPIDLNELRQLIESTR